MGAPVIFDVQVTAPSVASSPAPASASASTSASVSATTSSPVVLVDFLYDSGADNTIVAARHFWLLEKKLREHLSSSSFNLESSEAMPYRGLNGVVETLNVYDLALELEDGVSWTVGVAKGADKGASAILGRDISDFYRKVHDPYNNDPAERFLMTRTAGVNDAAEKGIKLTSVTS
jgi:hypothetical protein